jgi:hypothetical protein
MSAREPWTRFVRSTSLPPIVVALVALGRTVAAQESTTQPAAWPEAIEDNSFLIEEAYNQEAGTVQFIFNFLRVRPGGDWLATFTNEWPVPGEQHQFSYTVPYTLGGDQHSSSIGDVMLNYRYQALDEERDGVAFAPRLTVSVPTGSEREGLGMGVVGYQAALPFSKRVSRGLAVHLNLGAACWPGVAAATPAAPDRRADVWVLNQGASAVWLLSPRFDLMLEAVAYQTRAAGDGGASAWTHQATVSPGARYAFNFPAGQLVVGAAAPLGITRARPDPSVFLYLSWEAPLWHPGR